MTKLSTVILWKVICLSCKSRASSGTCKLWIVL